MPRRVPHALLVAACLAVVPLHAALSQAGPGVVYADGLRPFSEPLFWLNEGPGDRLPLIERPLGNRIGLAGAVPPRDKREGLIPSVSLAGVYRQDDQTDPKSESFPALAFGLDYIRIGPGWQVQADYGIAANDAKASGNGIDSHGGFLSFAYEPDPANRLTFFLDNVSTEDIQEATEIQALSVGATRFDSTSFLGTWTRAFDRTTGIELGAFAQRQATEAVGTSETHAIGANIGGWAFVSPTGRFDADLRVTRFELQPQNINSDIDRTLAVLRLGYTADLGPRMAANGHVSVLATSGDGGERFAGIGGEIERSWRFAKLGFGVERDIIAVPGLADLVMIDQATARIQMRLGRGVLANVALEQQRLKPLDAGSSTTQVTALEGQMSWALRNGFWAWGRLRVRRESSDGADRDDAQIILGVSRNLDF